MTVRYRDLRERLGCDLQYLNLGVVISTKMHDIDLCIPRPIWSNMLLTPEQCRAGRALLTWTQDDLATRAEVSRSTVRGFESGQHSRFALPTGGNLPHTQTELRY